jgi:acetate kinase
MPDGDVLVVNVGSTSLKYAVFATETHVVCRGRAAGIAAAGSSLIHDGPDGRMIRALAAPGLDAALDAMVEALGPWIESVACVAFKVVHGGDLTGTVFLDDRALAALRRFAVAAPAHNPPYIAAIERVRALLPDVSLVGTFETAFHADWPSEARAYALPQGWAERYGLRRYGFHGASHRYVAERLSELEPNARRVLSCHLGGSSSICAIVDGRSVDATMGFSPQSGLPQAERVGDLDAFAVAHLVSEGVPVDEAMRALASDGGLLGLSGLSGDLRELGEAEARGNRGAAFALNVFAYEARKAIGALAAAMGGLHAIAFTGGMGENSSTLRARICDGLAFLGVGLDDERNGAATGETMIGSSGTAVTVWVLPTDEERILVRAAFDLISEGAD